MNAAPTQILRLSHVFSCVVFAIALTACAAETGYRDLEQYVSSVKAKPAGRVTAVPEFKTYESYEYTAEELRDPFTALGLQTVADQGGDGLRPDTNRHKEPLEQFPLDTLKFAGHLERQDETWAIVTAPDGLVHRVQIGNYMGQNFGRITQISDSSVALLEIIPDGVGGWTERQASLALEAE